ncbi:MAG: porphobilinogen synthase [Bacteroidales bacterium]|nr:porphobilinogen synthase [Bacteroidales bacterium]
MAIFNSSKGDFRRFRPLRASREVRDRHADVRLSPEDFIHPLFVVEGVNAKEEIASMPGVFRWSIDRLPEVTEELLACGVEKALLFGVIPDRMKDAAGSAGVAADSLVCRAVRYIKERFPQVTVFTDVCLCEYVPHGHCGVLSGGEVDNDATLPLLAEMAFRHAAAGADFVAPSAMADGQVSVIRQRLTREGLPAKILAYSAKYASGFYGPFRDAAGSAPAFGDRSGYQMDYRTVGQGMEEIAADIEEGADWVMVKPALPYLDVVQRASARFPGHPLAAYQVSGEYSMLKQGAASGFFNEERIFAECLTAIKRAGARYLISYYTPKRGSGYS